MSARSFAMTGAMPGRSTFTATSVPSGSSARCTCATDALAAIGSRSKRRNTSSTGRPYTRCERCEHLLDRKRRHAVLQHRELVRDVGRQQVAARGQDLAELDEDRPQRFQRAAQAHGARRDMPSAQQRKLEYPARVRACARARTRTRRVRSARSPTRFSGV